MMTLNEPYGSPQGPNFLAIFSKLAVLSGRGQCFCHAKVFARACRRLKSGSYGLWISDGQIRVRLQITKNNTQTKNKI